ncbi:MAG: transposase family protein [Chitinophagales bacterium]
MNSIGISISKRYTYGGKIRKNKPPKRTRGKLPTVAHKLFFILYYYKINPLQEVFAASFDMDQSQTNKWINKIEKVFKASLESLKCLPTRSPKQLYKHLVK